MMQQQQNLLNQGNELVSNQEKFEEDIEILINTDEQKPTRKSGL